MGLERGLEGDECGVRELASGVDALYMSANADLSAALVADLRGWREAASGSEGHPVELLGESFRVPPYGRVRYPFLLEHEFGWIGLLPESKLPAVRVQPRSGHLHSVGVRAAVSWWRDLVEALTGTARLSASRIDLFSDWQGWNLEATDGARFVCRADRRDTYEERADLLGFTFGRRKTGTVLARIYDKTIESAGKLDVWAAVWGAAFDPAKRVLRVEFELGRKALREFGVDLVDDALDAAAGMWGSVTESWLSHRTPTSDATRSRWPVSPEWLRIQRPSMRGSIPGLERIRRARRASSLRSIMPALMGYTASFGAHSGLATLEETFEALPGALRDYGVFSGRSFEDRVAEKARRIEL